MKSQRVGALNHIIQRQDLGEWADGSTKLPADSKTAEMGPEIKLGFHANSELSLFGGLEEEGSNVVSNRETAH